MAQHPWRSDAVSLVEAFRAGERSPSEELEATLAAVESSELNAWSSVAADAARAEAERADVSLPLGGVPIGVKMGVHVDGWPWTEASIPLRDVTSDFDATMVTRLRGAGAVLVGQTTMSEFAGLNHTRTKLHGITHNPWDLEATPGGSSGGSAAAVAGGEITIGTAGDGGGSTRIPAGFCGLPGLKPTYGRIPKGPHMAMGNLVAVSGCLSRSVRDIARFFDVASGWDPRDPFSLTETVAYEENLGSVDLAGLAVAVSPDFGSAVVAGRVRDLVMEHADLLIADAGLRRVDIGIEAPEGSYEWAMGGMARIREQLGDRWPDCADDLTPAIRFGLEMAEGVFDLDMAARIETQRTVNNERMSEVFDQVDLVICPTNPDVAFPAPGPIRVEIDGQRTDLGNNGSLTIPANFYGNPGISIPVGTAGGLPVGMQVMARHHREDQLLELAQIVERERPWPLVAPGVD